MIDKTREIALKILYKIDKEESFSNIALDQEIKVNRQKLEDRDIGLISEIVYGTISWKLTIDEIIKKYSNIKLKKISIWILNILRMGVYQIIFLDKIPKSAAVNESVNLAKRYGHKSSSNFVNAMLRKISKEDYDEFFKIENKVEKISKTTSMPIWIVEELLEHNNIEDVQKICFCSNKKPKVSIRVNKLKISVNNLRERLQEKNIKAENGLIEDFLILDKIKNIEYMEEFKQGFFTVQDEAAGLVSKILNPKQNEKVLDACSSPGGKTTYLAEIMENKGEIQAWDIHDHRVNLVKKASQRLELDIINSKLQDATDYLEEYYEYFDKILLDVPCLGIGVLKRKPDIKWTRKKEDIPQIIKLQQKILQNCSKYLKKGGELIYSTCSILSKENEEVIEWFLNNNNNFEKLEVEGFESIEKCEFFKKNKYLQVFQNEKTDGFFICKLKKN